MAWPYPWQNVRDPLAIPAGALRHGITIQKAGTTRDKYGASQDTWTPVLTAFAWIATISSREVYMDSQFASQVTHRITLRWPGALGIAGGMQVVFGTRTFVIQGVENVQERDRVMNLMCLETDGAPA